MEQPSAQAQLSTTLVSMSIILITMFVYLNSIAKFDPQKKEKVITSIAEIFAPNVKRVPPEELQRLELMRTMSTTLTQLLAPIRGIQLTEAAGDSMLVTLESDTVFAAGDSMLNPEGVAMLNRFAEAIKTWPITVEIETHSDNVIPQNSRFQSHWALTMEQASAMHRLFLNYGMRPEQVSAAGLSDVHAATSNATAEGRAKNRRTVIRLRPALEPAQTDGGSHDTH